MYRHYANLKKAIASGTVDDTKAVGLLDQWLIEGKYTEEEALVLSCDMLAAGMDTVSIASSPDQLGVTNFELSRFIFIDKVATVKSKSKP